MNVQQKEDSENLSLCVILIMMMIVEHWVIYL